MGVPAPITFRQVQAAADTYIIAGSWGTNGNSAIVSTTVRGYDFTVAQDSGSNGNYTITFTHVGPTLISATATLQVVANGTDMEAQLGPYDPSAGTLVVRTVTAGVPTQLASNANNRVNFIAHFARNGLR